jgi:hypothetical protein
MRSNNYKILPLQKKERTIREKKKETRKGGLERFFSLQAALPRLFLGRILPKKAASYQNLTGSREPLKATQISTRTSTGSVGGLDFENFLARLENFRGHASRMRRRRIQLGILRRLLCFGDTLFNRTSTWYPLVEHAGGSRTAGRTGKRNQLFSTNLTYVPSTYTPCVHNDRCLTSFAVADST